jgi:hypothetical protein
MKQSLRPEQTPPITAEQLAAGEDDDSDPTWAVLLRVLDECEGNLTHTAEALGVGLRTLWNWLDRFDRLQAAVAEWRPVVTRARLEGAKGEACAVIAWQALEQAVATCLGNVTHVARELGIPLRTLQHWAAPKTGLPRLREAIRTARQAGAGVAGRMDETALTERLSVWHDGESWIATRGESPQRRQTGRGSTPTLAIWNLH